MPSQPVQQPDDSSGINELIRRAEAGDAQSLLEMGLIYRSGSQLAKNDAKAVACFRRAAELGSIPAAGLLAQHIVLGLGVQKETATGLKQLEEAAERGDLNSMRFLGEYLLGFSERADTERAFTWINAAANSGDVSSQLRLAEELLREGSTVDAERWFMRAAASGDPEATYAAAVFYKTYRVGDLWQNNVVELFKASAEKGSGQAALALARL